MQKKITAFTLVELIVVITILAILGTIAFISMSGYSKSSRDSVRLTDVGNMKTSLELYQINSGKYPLPDDKGEFTFSGDTLWSQGNFGDQVVGNLSRNFSEAPRDPLSEKTYIYSVASNRNEFQILNLLETDDIVLNNITGVNAVGTSIRIPKISGTYNGIFVKTSKYIVPLPSIITSEEVEIGTKKELTLSGAKSLITTGGKNIPKQGNINYSSGQLDLKILTGALLITENSGSGEKLEVIQMIQSFYSGTSLASEGIYEYILKAETTQELENLVEIVVLGNTANTIINTSSDIISSGTTNSGTTESGTFEALFTTPGIHTWTVPIDITSISVVCIGGGGSYGSLGSWGQGGTGGGGGGLRYINNLSVTSGTEITVTVGEVGSTVNRLGQKGGDSKFGNYITANGGNGGYGTTSDTSGNGGTGGCGSGGNGGGCGGNGGNGNYSPREYGGGGGAGGYSGNGGNGSKNTLDSWTSGNGGGGAGSKGSGGGGVGLYGIGTSGSLSGEAGSNLTGITYGGGKGSNSIQGSAGACRIIWPGNTRQFPNTNVGPNKKQIFITSTVYNGNLGGLTGADSKCQSRANAANLVGNYKALLSTSTTIAKNRVIYKNIGYTNVNDGEISPTGTDLFSSNWSSIRMDEFGNNNWGGNYLVFTNTTKTGDRIQSSTSNTCQDFTISSGGAHYPGDIGYGGSDYWFNSPDSPYNCSGTQNGDTGIHLLCFQE